ncbi:MAG: hypothetical protein V9H69_18610 [Anaerolineae bacterium]
MAPLALAQGLALAQPVSMSQISRPPFQALQLLYEAQAEPEQPQPWGTQ